MATIIDYNGLTEPADGGPRSAANLKQLYDRIQSNVNTWADLVPTKDNTGAVGSITSLGIAPTSGGNPGVNVQAGSGYGGQFFAASKSGVVDVFAVNNDLSVTAKAFHGVADSALALANTALAGLQNQVLAYNGSAWAASAVTGAMFASGTITADKLSGLWYSQSTLGALRVRVAPDTVWPAGSPIFFAGSDSTAINPAQTGFALASGQARIDLLYIDGSGQLQWSYGTPASAASAGLPANPAGVFVPVVYMKVYFGATAITGYADLGHDAFFYQNARLHTSPSLAAAISPHSLSISRLLDGAVYASTPASTTITVAPLSYYNSGNQQVDYPGGAFLYTPGLMTDGQPRWDLFYLDDAHNLLRIPGTPAASPTKPSFTTGQWPLAYVLIPGGGATSIVDEANYTGAAQQGYIHYVPGWLAGNAPNAAATTATGTLTTSGSSPNIAVTGVSVSTGGGPYAVAPVVVFNGGTGTAATATANLTAGVVTSVTVNTPGAYTVAPTSVSFSSTGGVADVLHGGTGGTTQASARSGIGAAQSGTNGDITLLNAITGIAGNVAFTGNQLLSPIAIGNVPLTVKGFSGQTADLAQFQNSAGTVLGSWGAGGNLGVGGAANNQIGIFQSGTLASPTSGVWGMAQNQALKPALSGGIAIWINAANGGQVDTSAITSVGGNVANAYGVQAGTISRLNGGVTNASVYAVNTITPAGTISGGTFTISDGTHTTAAINATDTVTTINTRLAAASVPYTASGAGPLSGGNVITLTATVAAPGKRAALTLPTNSPTGGGTLTVAQTYAGVPYVTNMYGGYFSAPIGGQNNAALFANGQVRADPSNTDLNAFAGFVDASWSVGAALVANKVMSADQTLDSVASFQGSAAGNTGLSEKAILSIFGTQNGDSTSIGHDMTGIEAQTYVGAANPYGRTWVMHLQSNISGVAPATDGNTIIIEAQVQNDGSDGQYIGQGTLKQKAGIAMLCGGPQNGTAAFIVQTGPSNDGLSAGRFWHGYYVDPAGLVVDNNHGGAFQLAGLFNVKHNGRVGIGTDAPNTNFMLDVFGEACFRQIATGRPTLTAYSMAAATTDILLTDAVLFNAGGQQTRIDAAGHVYYTKNTPATVPAQTLFTGAGTGPTNTGCAALSTDQSGRIRFTTGTAPAGTASIVTVTFAVPYLVAPTTVLLDGFNAQAAADRAKYYVAAITTTGFTLSSTAAGLTASVAYDIQYKVN